MRLIGANSEKKEAASLPPWLTDGIDGRGLCTLIFSVHPPAPVYALALTCACGQPHSINMTSAITTYDTDFLIVLNYV